MSRPFPSGIVVLRLRLPCRAVCQLRIGIKARHELIGPAGQTAHYNAQQSPTAGVKRAQYLLIIYSSSLSVPLCPSLTHWLLLSLCFFFFLLAPLCFFFSLLFLDFFLFLPFSSTVHYFFYLPFIRFFFYIPTFFYFLFPVFPSSFLSSPVLSHFLLIHFLLLCFPFILPCLFLLSSFCSPSLLFFFFSSSPHSSLYSQYPPPQALSLSS